MSTAFAKLPPIKRVGGGGGRKRAENYMEAWVSLARDKANTDDPVVFIPYADFGNDPESLTEGRKLARRAAEYAEPPIGLDARPLFEDVVSGELTYPAGLYLRARARKVVTRKPRTR